MRAPALRAQKGENISPDYNSKNIA